MAYLQANAEEVQLEVMVFEAFFPHEHLNCREHQIARSVKAGQCCSEAAEGASGGWPRLHRLRLVSCGPTLGKLKPFAACITAVTSTSELNMSTSMRGDKPSSEISARKAASVRSWWETGRSAMMKKAPNALSLATWR